MGLFHGWGLFSHPSHSPDLALSDFLLLHLKWWLREQQFEEDDKLEIAIVSSFDSQAADFCGKALRKLVPHYKKCLDVNGDYVEKGSWFVEN